TAPPPMLPRGLYLGLDWVPRSAHIYTRGVLAKVALGAGWRVDAGLFLSGKTNDDNFSDLLLGVRPDGSASNRLVVADGNNMDRSLSGELRLTREWTRGAFSHTVTADLRGRSKDRLFGGTVNLPLGPGSIYSTSGWTQRAFTLGPENQDHVRQLTAGLAYSVLWRGKASLDISLAKSTYKKTVDFADPLLTDPVTTDRPLLWSVGASMALAKDIILFGGLTRGLEEALIAPEIASNRAEAPPAIRTKQVEIGLRVGLSKDLALVAAAFQIAKPYFNLDPAQRYRQLGTLTNKGIEISLTGKLAPGLTIVGGTMFLDPTIQGEAVDAKQIGPRPVGQLRRRSQINVDWRLESGQSPLSFDLALESLSSRMANAANTLRAPARTTMNIGARYRFSLGKLNAVVRPALLNITNNYGWQVSSSGGWTYTSPRTFTLGLAADF
ncbi:MAG: TonB-dependent receptor, partial [Novosphingobium sp.]